MSKTPKNAKAAPMTYESKRTPNPSRQRTAVAAQASDLTVDELRAKAAELQVDTTGATTKDELVAAIRAAR